MAPNEKNPSEPGSGDSGLAAALIEEFGDPPQDDALLYDEHGEPVSRSAKARS